MHQAQQVIIYTWRKKRGKKKEKIKRRSISNIGVILKLIMRYKERRYITKGLPSEKGVLLKTPHTRNIGVQSHMQSSAVFLLCTMKAQTSARTA